MTTAWKDANGADANERKVGDRVLYVSFDSFNECWLAEIIVDIEKGKGPGDGWASPDVYDTRSEAIAAVERAAGVHVESVDDGLSLGNGTSIDRDQLSQTPLEASVARDAPGPTPRAGWDDGHIAHIVADADALRAQVQALTEELAKAHASHEEWIGIIGKEQDQHRAALRDARALAYRLVRVATRKGTIDEPEIADIEAALAFGPEGTK